LKRGEPCVELGEWKDGEEKLTHPPPIRSFEPGRIEPALQPLKGCCAKTRGEKRERGKRRSGGKKRKKKKKGGRDHLWFLVLPNGNQRDASARWKATRGRRGRKGGEEGRGGGENR